MSKRPSRAASKKGCDSSGGSMKNFWGRSVISVFPHDQRGMCRQLSAHAVHEAGVDAALADDGARPAVRIGPHIGRDRFAQLLASDLPDRLEHQEHPAHARMARGQPAAVGVDRQRPAEAKVVADEVLALALRTEAEIL